jgi:hypothetical protein
VWGTHPTCPLRPHALRQLQVRRAWWHHYHRTRHLIESSATVRPWQRTRIIARIPTTDYFEHPAQRAVSNPPVGRALFVCLFGALSSQFHGQVQRMQSEGCNRWFPTSPPKQATYLPAAAFLPCCNAQDYSDSSECFGTLKSSMRFGSGSHEHTSTVNSPKYIDVCAVALYFVPGSGALSPGPHPRYTADYCSLYFVCTTMICITVARILRVQNLVFLRRVFLPNIPCVPLGSR